MSERTIDELADAIRARLDEDEQILMAVSDGPYYPEKWTAVERSYSTVRRWHVDGQHSNVASGMFRGDAAHIERHDPHRVLADVAMKRALLARLLAEKHTTCEDSWHSCSAADVQTGDRDGEQECDCGRDVRVRGYLELMAGADETEAAG